MNTSSKELDILINEFPEEEEAVKRLMQYIAPRQGEFSTGFLNKTRQTDEREWEIEWLYHLVNPSSKRVLARMLARLVEDGMLKQKIRVESVMTGGIGDFDSITEIPNPLYDCYVGHNVPVELKNIKLIYKLL